MLELLQGDCVRLSLVAVRSGITLVMQVKMKVLVEFVLGPTAASTQYNTPAMPQGNLEAREPVVIGHVGYNIIQAKKTVVITEIIK